MNLIDCLTDLIDAGHTLSTALEILTKRYKLSDMAIDDLVYNYHSIGRTTIIWLGQ